MSMFVPEEVGDMSLAIFRFIKLSHHIFVNIPLFQSFGNIYLGETFSSYVCVHNDSTEVCSSVSVR